MKLPRRIRGTMIGAMVMTALMAAPGCEHDRDRLRSIKIGTVLPASHPTAACLGRFADRLSELSGGQMRARVYYNSQLGSANEVLELCRMGDVEMTHVSVASLSVYVPQVNALAMPFIWNGSEHQARVLDGKVGDMIRAKARPQGLEVMGFFDSGTRNITTKKGPIQRPEDLKGLKIRVMNAPLMVSTVDALGASATAMNQGEVYTALQMGVIDGWENNPMTITTFRMYETGCIHFAWTRHFSIPDLLVASEPFLGRLSEQQRGWVEQAARETVLEQRELWRESEETALQEMRDNGMLINEVDLEPFRKRVAPIYDAYYERYGASFRELCDLIREAG